MSYRGLDKTSIQIQPTNTLPRFIALLHTQPHTQRVDRSPPLSTLAAEDTSLPLVQLSSWFGVYMLLL